MVLWNPPGYEKTGKKTALPLHSKLDTPMKFSVTYVPNIYLTLGQDATKIISKYIVSEL